MKRRAFLGGTAIGGLAGMVSTAANGEPEVAGTLLVTPAVLMAPRADGIDVVWAVSRLCRGWVEWKSAGGESGKVAEDAYGLVPQEDGVFKVRIDGLKPGGNYETRVVVEAVDGVATREETAWKKFSTLDPKAESSRFVVWNDTHENHETIKALQAATPTADFLLWNGDTCNDWKEESQLVPTLLNPAGQDISAGRPMFLTWGNHDVRGKYAFRVARCIATPEGRPYYAFRSGPVAVICLHTGEDKPDDHPSFGGRVAFEELRREQGEWLKKMVAQPEFRDAPNRLLFCHIPLRWTEETPKDYANGGYDNFSRMSRDVWHDTLVKWGVQVVISGHMHQETWIPANEQFPYMQVISGGPKPAAARWIECVADAAGLRIVMKDLTGKVTREEKFARL